jgi:hypothetical protein
MYQSKERQEERHQMWKISTIEDTTSKGIINPEGTRFYYLRNKVGHPYATVCLKANAEGVYARGIAICSANDSINRAEGRKLAYARVIIAMELKESSRPILKSDSATIAEFLEDTDFSCKAEYNATLCEREESLFNS